MGPKMLMPLTKFTISSQMFRKSFDKSFNGLLRSKNNLLTLEIRNYPLNPSTVVRLVGADMLDLSLGEISPAQARCAAGL